MDFLANLALGASTAFTPENLLYCLIGVVLGTLIGVLPGIGPVATIAMLLPITYKIGDPTTSLIMLAGIYYGCQYGASTTAILINLPGEPSSVITTLDGHQMARQGRAGPALATAAVGSFFAGTVATILIAAFAPALATVALSFGPPEYFSLMVLGLFAAVVLSNGSIIKSTAMIVLGLLLGLIGTDVNSGLVRFNFGFDSLIDGVEFGVVAMGMFGIAEIIYNLNNPEQRDVIKKKMGSFMPNRDEIRRAVPACLRGTVIGSVLGILPGSGGILASFVAYAAEKKISKDPSRFGKGAIEGVAAPESANNAGAQTSFIPMLTLGIPTTPVMALMIAAMMIHSVVPGPQVVSNNPSLFWGLIVSMWIGNLMLLVLNLPMIGMWVKLLKVPYQYLYPTIILLCCIGAYSINNSVWDVFMLIPFGILGYYLKKWACEPAPLLMGMILGVAMEEHLRRTLTISGGDWQIFLDRPISAGLIALTVFLLVFSVLRSLKIGK